MTQKKTLEQFIKECRAVHGDKYDYSITKYTKWDCKIEYICPIHGIQSQRADDHRHGRGCKQCGRERTKKAFAYTTELFIETCNKKHNNRYNYPNTVYIDYNSEVKIECELHGEFIQMASYHLRGSGCQKCGFFNKAPGPLVKPTNGEEFIRLSIEVHGSQYDYSQVEFTKYYSSVTIVCLIHGSYKCVPTSHLKGIGCATCQSFDAFVKKASSMHKGKFEYDKSTYIRSKSKMRIVCRDHGEFWEAPGEHTRRRGQGGYHCFACFLESKRISVQEVIKRSKEIHGPAYRFDKLVLGKTLEEEALFYCIKCAKYFSQKPINHLQGYGCSLCCESKHEKLIKRWLQTTDYKFEPQKVFPDLRYQNSLRCDFYIEQFNLIIEFDGIQHFEPVEAWGGVEKFLKVQARDRVKNEYCTKKRINLLRMKDGQNVVYEIQKFIEMIRANEKDIILHLIYGKLITL